MDQNTNPKQQLVERLKTANNILVTVSRNPSVDQLAACIGLTLVLNKLGKHATAVFSGQVPSTIEFLQPGDTIEKNTDSLRDFIIALDKSKADKLRYKVEDTVVKIFITPYRTSLSADDLEFSQGDFNVDAVVAIGVKEQQDLDEAIVAHGRILHDATVTTINTSPDGGLGSINWHDSTASSLCELVEEVVHDLGSGLLDGQVATALLTGIVAETNRFSNEKTSPQTMSVSAALMSAGANQQLVASQLDLAAPHSAANESSEDGDSEQPAESPKKPDDGTLEITHPRSEKKSSASKSKKDNKSNKEADSKDKEEEPASEDSKDSQAVTPEEETPGEQGTSGQDDESKPPAADEAKPSPSRLIIEPPTLGGTLTASSEPDTELEGTTDPLSALQKENQPLLTHSEPAAQPEAVTTPTTDSALQPAPADWTPPEPEITPEADLPAPSLNLPQPADNTSNSTSDAPIVEAPVSETPAPEPEPEKAEETLSDLEKAVESPHAQAPDLEAARNEVMDALNSAPPATPPEPVQALNAQPIDLSHPTEPAPQPSMEFDPKSFGVINDPDVHSANGAEPSSNGTAAASELPPANPLFVAPEQPAISLPSAAPEPPHSEQPAASSDPTIPPVPPPLPPSVYAPPSNATGQQ